MTTAASDVVKRIIIEYKAYSILSEESSGDQCPTLEIHLGDVNNKKTVTETVSKNTGPSF